VCQSSHNAISDLSLQDLLQNWTVWVGLSSVLALCFAIGYFYAFNISWFSFFSVTDHLVFALRALPVAFAFLLIGSVLLDDTGLVKGLPRRTIVYLWVVFLAVMIVFLLFDNLIGLAVSLSTVAIVTWYSTRKTLSPAVRLLTFGANIAVTCFVLGFCDGELFKQRPLENTPIVKAVYYYLIADLKFRPTASAYVTKTTSPKDGPAGHVIFSGSTGVLIYDYNCKCAHWTRWENIDEVVECKTFDCSDRPKATDPHQPIANSNAYVTPAVKP
jgi:hypothetical protein